MYRAVRVWLFLAVDCMHTLITVVCDDIYLAGYLLLIGLLLLGLVRPAIIEIDGACKTDLARSATGVRILAQMPVTSCRKINRKRPLHIWLCPGIAIADDEPL
jgi:hypothetical protein